MKGWRGLVFACAAVASLAACSPDELATPSPLPSGSNEAPTIAGQPSTSASAGANWTFQPAASDPDGDAVTFSATGLPPWVSLDPKTGRLSGTPTSADVGQSANIVISVSDGIATANLPAFAINVTSGAAATGSAMLQWLPPTEYTDGSSLSAASLAGYRVYHGTSAANLNDVRQVSSPDTTSYLVDNLASGTHYFAVTAVTVTGMESALSAIGSKTIQ